MGAVCSVGQVRRITLSLSASINVYPHDSEEFAYLTWSWIELSLFLICSWGDESHSPTAWIGWLDPGLWSFPAGPWSILDVDHTWKSICPLGQYLSPNISGSVIILRSQKFGWVSHLTLDQCDHASLKTESLIFSLRQLQSMSICSFVGICFYIIFHPKY